MPLLDVSFVLDDPMFQDCMQVQRRADIVGSNGRTTPTVDETFPQVFGVVTQQSPADLLRREDSEIVPRRIFIASRFCFRNASRDADGTSWQPDLITWNGGQYIVTEALPYSRYGQGFYECIAESKSAMDPPQ